MYDASEWPSPSRAFGTMSEERRRYVEHLRRVHDEARFRLALLDEIAAEPSDEERFVFEAEMLANYYVA